MSKPIIPQMKVGELLDAYPQLEEVLIKLSPVFGKLKNPILRKTVARVASLQQAAAVGQVAVDVLINTLRQAVGQPSLTEMGEAAFSLEPKPWFNPSDISERFDARPIIEQGNSPMGEILKVAMGLQQGQLLELTTPFLPAPIIEVLHEKGFDSFSLKITETEVKTYFKKSN